MSTRYLLMVVVFPQERPATNWGEVWVLSEGGYWWVLLHSTVDCLDLTAEQPSPSLSGHGYSLLNGLHINFEILKLYRYEQNNNSDDNLVNMMKTDCTIELSQNNCPSRQAGGENNTAGPVITTLLQSCSPEISAETFSASVWQTVHIKVSEILYLPNLPFIVLEISTYSYQVKYIVPKRWE